ncbi:LacI family DNA-binding transcriptional regulator [Alkalibacillus haloalkaliphilus]|uniref:LacI family DNA-binding transcriptional regulator n=1 Tax=Alkalibacillus haloalkaliphilus TaxID=94136 RepID=UPI0029361F46|nr:LacI family DNA-binding transcriptional regulator [Alkalibacillus haloalkaliphilus]MDV2582242.1 LacI family DNA-binding transcriptional regulator [Alkalibacillus haloalkaliphilus]
MVSIKDVAKKAGVSVGVVSKALNNYPDVGEKTRQRVLETANELEYSPNRVARMLSSKKNSAISLISSGFEENDQKDNNSFELFKGIYFGSQQLNLDFSIYFTDSFKQEEQSYVQFCRERNIGGAILQGIRLDDPFFKEMVDTEVPCVLIDVLMDDPQPCVGSVTIQNREATKALTNYLIEKGHEDIAIMAGTKEAYVNEERLSGVEEALVESGLTFEDRPVFYADFDDGEAYEKAKTFLQTHRPTAFVCFSDLMAYGVMRAAQDLGLSIPEDLSVVGFDDSMIAGMTSPGITTVAQDFFEMGHQAALLLNRIVDGEADETEVYLNYKLLERESVKDLTRQQ